MEDFGSSWGARDGASVCDLLSPEARSEVAEARGEPCPSGVLQERLPDPAAVSSVEVWGDEAQVRTATDTVFLAQFDTGWKVTAAGCSPRPGKPYDCVISGG